MCMYEQTLEQVQLPEMNADNRGVIHVSHHGTQVSENVLPAKRETGKNEKSSIFYSSFALF